MQFFSGSSLTSVAPESTPAPAAPPGTNTGANAQVLYVFNRNGVCLLYREWHRPLRTLDPTQDHKLMFGLLFSLRSFTAKIDPTTAEKGNLGVPLLPGQGCSFHSFRTNTYKLNFIESPSGIKDTRYHSFQSTYLHAGYVHLFVIYNAKCPYRCQYRPVRKAADIVVTLILITHPRTGDQRDSLKHIYNLYVEYVVKNPLYAPGTPIKCELFNKHLDQYVRTLI